jgi:hypothetical protein
VHTEENCKATDLAAKYQIIKAYQEMSATIKFVCTTVYLQLSYTLITVICTALVTVSGTPYILLNLSMLLLMNISYTDVDYIKLR